jgi:hypothetical protein
VTFPTPFTVGLHNYSQGADDGYGNTLPVFTPAKDQPGVEYPVCGWWLPTSVEESGNKRRVITTLVSIARRARRVHPRLRQHSRSLRNSSGPTDFPDPDISDMERWQFQGDFHVSTSDTEVLPGS